MKPKAGVIVGKACLMEDRSNNKYRVYKLIKLIGDKGEKAEVYRSTDGKKGKKQVKTALLLPIMSSIDHKTPATRFVSETDFKEAMSAYNSWDNETEKAATAGNLLFKSSGETSGSDSESNKEEEEEEEEEEEQVVEREKQKPTSRMTRAMKRKNSSSSSSSMSSMNGEQQSQAALRAARRRTRSMSSNSSSAASSLTLERRPRKTRRVAVSSSESRKVPSTPPTKRSQTVSIDLTESPDKPEPKPLKAKQPPSPKQQPKEVPKESKKKSGESIQSSKVKPCKCGSTTHSRITFKLCPLNKTNKEKTQQSRSEEQGESHVENSDSEENDSDNNGKEGEGDRGEEEKEEEEEEEDSDAEVRKEKVKSSKHAPKRAKEEAVKKQDKAQEKEERALKVEERSKDQKSAVSHSVKSSLLAADRRYTGIKGKRPGSGVVAGTESKQSKERDLKNIKNKTSRHSVGESDIEDDESDGSDLGNSDSDTGSSDSNSDSNSASDSDSDSDSDSLSSGDSKSSSSSSSSSSGSQHSSGASSSSKSGSSSRHTSPSRPIKNGSSVTSPITAGHSPVTNSQTDRIIYEGPLMTLPDHLRREFLTPLEAEISREGGSSQGLANWRISVFIRDGKQQYVYIDEKNAKYRRTNDIIKALGLLSRESARQGAYSFAAKYVQFPVQTPSSLVATSTTAMNLTQAITQYNQILQLSQIGSAEHRLIQQQILACQQQLLLEQQKLMAESQNTSSSTSDSSSSDGDDDFVSTSKTSGSAKHRLKKTLQPSFLTQVRRLGYVPSSPQYQQFNLLFPIGFECHRKWVPSKKLLEAPSANCKAKLTIHRSSDGPEFRLQMYDGEVYKGSSPDEVWRPAVKKMYKVVLSSFKGLDIAVKLAEACSAKLKKTSGHKSDKIFRKSLVSALEFSSGEEEYKRFFSGAVPWFDSSLSFHRVEFNDDSVSIGVQVGWLEPRGEDAANGDFGGEGSQANKERYVGITSFTDGSVGSFEERAILGDSIIAVRAGLSSEAEWEPVSSPDSLTNVLKTPKRPIALLVQRDKVYSKELAAVWNTAKQLYDGLLCDPLKLVAASQAARVYAFELGALLCGLVDGKYLVQHILEGMIPADQFPNHVYFLTLSQNHRDEIKKRVQEAENMIEKLVKKCTSSQKNLLKKYETANRHLMKAEDSRASKVRSMVRRDEDKHKWQNFVQPLLPPLLVGELTDEKQIKDRVALARSLQCPPELFARKPDLLQLGPVYDVMEERLRRENPLTNWDSENGQAKVVLETLISRLELPTWQAKQRNALSTLVLKHRGDLAKALGDQSASSKMLLNGGFNTSSLHMRCIAKKVSQFGYEFEKSGRQRIVTGGGGGASGRGGQVGMKTSSSSSSHHSNFKVSKKIASAVRGVMKRLLTEVTKNHREWERDQRQHSAARKKLLKEKNLAQKKLTSEFLPTEYATLCAAVDVHGTDWVAILSDPMFSDVIRSVHMNPNILMDAWNDLDVVVSIQGCDSEMYPLMGYYVRLSAKAMERKRDEGTDTFFQSFATTDETGVDDPFQETMVFLGSGCRDHLGTQLLGQVVLRSSPDAKTWSLHPSGEVVADLRNQEDVREVDENSSYLYVVFGDDAPTLEVIKEEPSRLAAASQTCFVFEKGNWQMAHQAALKVLKLPTQVTKAPPPVVTASSDAMATSMLTSPAGRLDVVPKNLTRDEVVNRLRQIVELRKKLERAQKQLERKLEPDDLARLDAEQSLRGMLLLNDQEPL